MLLEEISKLNTEWRDIIMVWIRDNGKKWDLIEEHYKVECEKYNDIYPIKSNIFRCLNYFNPSNTKVVILGQDPYHGEQQANGLAFAVNENIPYPPSLRNINNILDKTIGKKLNTRTLENWVKQGVLLLNTSLTVRAKSPGSHMVYWKDFTQFLIDYIDKNCEGVVFVAWGAFALGKLENIDKNKHYLIVSSHPSPLSCRKCLKQYPSFMENDIFNKINDKLDDKIDW